MKPRMKQRSTTVVYENQTSDHVETIRRLTNDLYSSLEGRNLSSSIQFCSGSDPEAISSNDKIYSETIDEEDPLPPPRFVAGKSRQNRDGALGGSLHRSNFKKRDVHSLGSSSSHGTNSSPILGLGKKELLRKRGGFSRHGTLPSCHIAYPPFDASYVPSPSSVVKEMESSRLHHQRRSSLYQEVQHHYYSYIPSHKRCSHFIKKRWFMACQLAMLAIFGGAIMCYANHHISMAQHKLEISQTEKSQILREIEWVEKRFKEKFGGDGNNRQNSQLIKDPKANSAPERLEAQALLESVEALDEAFLQQTSRARLEEAFPSSILHSQIEVALHLEGLPNPLVIEVPYTKVPYTAWTWINQILHDRWDYSTFRRVMHHSVEIAPDSPVEMARGESPMQMAPDGPPQGDSKLEIHETSIPIDDPFVVGMKNSEMGLILTIHLDPYGCGLHGDEVCFGKLVEGFDSLDQAQTSHSSFTIGSVKILEEPDNRRS